ncbi:unnamed protein product [Aureobasidium vineae]|uniref:Uncharacterized protein n=1 Tax=Aureobasidium vineae TaxID=2773715 RepID=A0A9N8JBU5_9PEZI|nr:unnamed protein product [Aureobasidium vineae]
MALKIEIQGEGAASRMADKVEIHIGFKSKSFYRHEASITLFKAVEQLAEILKQLSPKLENCTSMFQATANGPITSWSIGTQHSQSQTTPIANTKAHQTTHIITTSLDIAIHDLKILDQVSRAITKTPCVARLAAKDALNKAIAIASSIGFDGVTAEEVVLQASQQTLLNASSHFVEEDLMRQLPYQVRPSGCFGQDFDSGHGYNYDHSDSKWASHDEAGDLDVWTLILAPEEIVLAARIVAKFSATSSTGWVYEELDQHRFLTR